MLSHVPWERERKTGGVQSPKTEVLKRELEELTQVVVHVKGFYALTHVFHIPLAVDFWVYLRAI